MSVIAAIKVPGRAETWIGSDTQGQFGEERVDLGSKWAQSDDAQWAFGIVGDARGLTICRANRSQLFAGLDAHGPDLGYEFTERLRHVLRVHDWGFKPGEDSCAPVMGMHGLLASPTRLHRILPDMTVVTVLPGHFVAEGSGSQYTIGCIEGMCNVPGDGKLKPVDMLTMAMRCAINNDSGCGGTIWVNRLHTPDPAAVEAAQEQARKIVAAAKSAAA